MLKLTRADLRMKSDRQLSDMFNALIRLIAICAPASGERAIAISALALVAHEQAVRSFGR